MLVELKWPTLEDCRKKARLMLLFKFVNKLIYVPNQYLPVLSYLLQQVPGQTIP